MARSPTVSVVIPTFNRANIVRRAINSVLNQTFDDLELIVVDGGSTDRTPHIISKYRGNGVKYIRHPTNMGIPRSRNDGIKSSSGTYIAFLDDDDEWLPKKLEKQVGKLSELDQDWGAVYTGCKTIKNNKVERKYIPKDEGYIFGRLLYGNMIHTSTSLVRRKCLEKVGLFDTSLRCSEDWDMWLRIAKQFKIAVVPEILAVNYKGHESISSDLLQVIQGRRRILEKYYEDLKENPGCLSRLYRRLGKAKSLLNGNSAGSSYFKKAFLADNTNIKAYLDYMASKVPFCTNIHAYLDYVAYYTASKVPFCTNIKAYLDYMASKVLFW